MKRKLREDLMKEREDYLVALSRLAERLPGIPLEDVVKKLGMERDHDSAGSREIPPFA